MSSASIVAEWVEGGIRGASEVIFPSNDFGAPDWRETEMVSRTLSYLDELPPRQRGLLQLLFCAVEWVGGALTPGWGRFSRQTPARRLAAIRRWKASSLFLIKALGDATKASLAMIYMSHPSVVAYISMYKSCDRPGDTLGMPVRADALGESR